MEENATKGSTQEKLEHKLSMRHTKEELVQLNIMKADLVSPALQSSFRNYQKAKMEDSLNRKLSNRPSKERLLQLGVLKDEAVSPKLQQSKIELEKAKLENFLSKKLANRPTVEELQDKNVLKDKDQDPAAWRDHVEKSLERFLANKYSNRFSSREIGEAIPMINWVDEDITLPSKTSSASSSPRSISSPQPEGGLGKAPRREPKTVLKKHQMIERELSVSSLQQKNQFIMNVVAEGRFICRNCCTEFFEGPEMASPRYSYNNFFDEEDWRDLGLIEPSHHPEGKAKSLCNLCFGVCSCGLPLTHDICDNCGTIRPNLPSHWRAPDYARPRTIDEWQEMRRAQLVHYNGNYADTNLVGERQVNVSFAEEAHCEIFERYRFRNTLTDEGMLMEECPEAPGGVLFSIEGDDDQIYEVETETDGFYFLKPDSAGNLFVVGVSDEDATAKNSTRIYLHDPSKNWFYYGDSSAGKIYCWDPATDSIRPVG